MQVEHEVDLKEAVLCMSKVQDDVYVAVESAERKASLLRMTAPVSSRTCMVFYLTLKKLDIAIRQPETHQGRITSILATEDAIYTAGVDNLIKVFYIVTVPW
jgi:hypothetical protein